MKQKADQLLWRIGFETKPEKFSTKQMVKVLQFSYDILFGFLDKKLPNVIQIDEHLRVIS